MTRNPRLAPPLVALASAVLAGCASVGQQNQSLVPTRYKTQAGPYAIYTNFPLPSDAPAVRHLQALERQVEATLDVRVDPGASPIEVYILDDRRAFTHFLTYYYPELPPRRAFFFAQGPRRVVYTYLGDRLEEDLRHEATHALMHVAFVDLPLWLDEGLAEYFEAGDNPDGLNAEHLRRLPVDLEAGWSPDLRRLEALRDVRQMTPRDYRESWAWVHYLLNTTGANRGSLLAYLGDLRQSPDPVPLSERLEAPVLAASAAADSGPAARLLAHLDALGRPPVAVAPDAGRPRPDPAVRPATVRLQDEAETPPAPPRRRGLFRRLADALLGRPEPR